VEKISFLYLKLRTIHTISYSTIWKTGYFLFTILGLITVILIFLPIWLESSMLFMKFSCHDYKFQLRTWWQSNEVPRIVSFVQSILSWLDFFLYYTNHYHECLEEIEIWHNMDPFTNRRTHRPLTGDNIRVLTLQPGLFNNPIHCQLEQISLSAGRAYEALSYVWGNARDTAPIVLDKSSAPVACACACECALRCYIEAINAFQ
jgi:hypothetical protein